MSQKRVYGLEWDEQTDQLDIEIWFIQQGGYFLSEGRRYGEGKFYHYKQMISLLWVEDDWHRWADLMLKRKCENDIVVLMGSSDCVAGHTRILDPLTGDQPTIESLCQTGNRPWVMTMNGPELAGVPFVKGKAELFEVECENGSRFTASGRHLVLSGNTYVPVSSLRISQSLAAYDVNRPSSTAESDPLTRLPDVRHSLRKSPDFQDDYRACPYFYGELPHPALGSVQELSPLPTDAQRHRYRRNLGVDVQENRPMRTHGEAADLPAISDFGCRVAFLERLFECLREAGMFSHVAPMFQRTAQSRPASGQRAPFRGRFSGAFDTLKSSSLSCRGVWVSQTRIASIRSVGSQVFYDLTVPKAHHYFAEGTIHHNSNKTYASARYVLADYWAHHENTLWMVSSTELRGAELRIWGKLKELFNRAKERYPNLPGTILESRTCITTETIDRDGDKARLLTKGIIFIPCKSGDNWVGLGAYAGIKPTRGGRLGHCGDEVSFMETSFLQAYANWYGKENFQGLLDGNPTEIDDPLCTAAEPVDGWDGWTDNGKTQEWRSKFYGAWVIAYDGRDSPNFDFPKGLPLRYPYLISRKKLDAVALAEGLNSPLYHMQCIGKPIPGQAKLRVFTVGDCEQADAFKSVIWDSGPFLDIVGLDAAYSGEGGDRCALQRIKCGKAVGGLNVIECFKPELVPVKVQSTEKPDLQIAKWVRAYCTSFNVPPENMFFDGRATLTLSFAQTWSDQVVPVDFGGPATDRPVSKQHFIDEIIDGQLARRLKRCDEHYFNFVTELWFAIHYLLRGRQIRNMPRETAEEGARRRWKPVGRSHIQVEPKKDMKLRTKQSPDLTDALATAIEGARRRGFAIDIITEVEVQKDDDWLRKAQDQWNKQRKKTELNYSA